MPPFARNLIDRCNVVSPNRQLETGLGVIPRRFTLPMKKNLLLAAVCLTATAFAQKFENLALTPPMGWNSWNTFAANIDEDLIKGTADTMIANGMRDAGYVYLVVDDCWEAKERDADGNIVPDPVKFPHGMKALGDYLHAKGFKFGIHNCAGTETCAGFPGGRGHEYQDALRYAAWGVDFLKYDWCMHGTADARETYKTMRDALHKAGRPIVFSLCEWGQNKPWEWAKDVGHLWRTTGDIMAGYDSRQRWESGWKLILDQQYTLVTSNGPDGIGQYAGPGHWNDPDMLEVGNKGLTLAESRAHFSLWCIIAAPLIAGNDVRHMSKEVYDILTDKDVIAIDQDPLGKQGWRFRAETGREIWVRELSGGDWAVCVLNSGATAADLTTDWSAISILQREYAVRDVWAKKDLGTTRTPRTDRVESHDVMLFRLSPVK
jgi:alpha-galactosidase